jgi:hypothetical protein
VEVRHINRSSCATRQPEVDTSTKMLCHRVSESLPVVLIPSLDRGSARDIRTIGTTRALGASY